MMDRKIKDDSSAHFIAKYMHTWVSLQIIYLNGEQNTNDVSGPSSKWSNFLEYLSDLKSRRPYKRSNSGTYLPTHNIMRFILRNWPFVVNWFLGTLEVSSDIKQHHVKIELYHCLMNYYESSFANSKLGPYYFKVKSQIHEVNLHHLHQRQRLDHSATEQINR